MKKGFTLIELLAVIVILAIIAVIAVPIVLNIINESKNEAGLRSAEMYVKAAELSIVQATLKNKNIKDGTYNIADGDICLEDYDSTTKKCIDSIDEGTDIDILEVEVNGKVPTTGEITITNGAISQVELNFKDQNTIVKDSNGDLVYQDSSSSVKLCTANTSLAKALVWQGNDDPGQPTSYAEEDIGLLAKDDGAYTPGVAYTCNFGETEDSRNLIFFVLSSTEDTVTLILGSNLGNRVAWSEDGENHKDDPETEQAVTAKAALEERTVNWSSKNGGKLNDAQMSTIKLPTANQIAEVIGQTFSDSFISGLPEWLYSQAKSPNTNTSPTVAYGYWTSNPRVVDYSLAWIVSYNGNVDYYFSVDSSNYYGVRPVITLSKSDI